MVDEMDLLSRMKDAAPLRAEAFEEARTKLRAAMAATAHPETQPRQVPGARPRKLAWGTRGKAGLGITAVAAAVAAVVLGVTSSPAPSHPAAGHPGSGPGARLAAYAVSQRADGSIQVSFFGEMRDPAGLQRTLRADGVPASVTFIGQQNPACQVIPGTVLDGKPQAPAALGRVVTWTGGGSKTTPAKTPPPLIMTIRPSALPSGDGLQIAVMQGIPAGPSGPWPYPKGSGHPTDEENLLKASPQCTGS
jgi:hypothetical protein